jgi:hypothetical protein
MCIGDKECTVAVCVPVIISVHGRYVMCKVCINANSEKTHLRTCSLNSGAHRSVLITQLWYVFMLLFSVAVPNLILDEF